jgi:hypothetical protein
LGEQGVSKSRGRLDLQCFLGYGGVLLIRVGRAQTYLPFREEPGVSIDLTEITPGLDFLFQSAGGYDEAGNWTSGRGGSIVFQLQVYTPDQDTSRGGTAFPFLFYTAMDPATPAVFASEQGDVSVNVSAFALGTDPVGVAINDRPDKISVAGSPSLPRLLDEANDALKSPTGGGLQENFCRQGIDRV